MIKTNVFLQVLQMIGLILLFLLMISCENAMTAATPTPEPIFPITITFTVASSTPSQALLSPTPTTTDTPVSNLSREQAQELVLELLEPNESCSFPCWWNIRPGLSDMISTQSFFDSLTSISIRHSFSPTDGYAILLIDNNNVDMNIDITYTARDEKIEWMKVRLCATAKCEVGFDDPNYLDAIAPYDMSGILTRYGEPTDIRMFMEKQWDWFSILMFYPESGTLIEYLGKYETQGDFFRICPRNGYVNFWFWPIERDYSFADLLSWKYFDVRFLGPSDYYLPVAEATNFEISSFIETFKNANNEECFNTESRLWPEP